MASDYLTTGVPFGAMPLVEIRDPVLAGPGHGPIEAAVDTYRQLADRLQAAGDAVRAALLAAQAAHEGAAGEASARHISAVIAPGDVGAAQARLAARALEDQATYHVRARNELAALRPEDLSPNYAIGVRQPVPDLRKERLHEEAVAAATVYQDTTNHNLTSAFQPFQPPEPVTVGLAAAPAPAAGGSAAGATAGAIGSGTPAGAVPPGVAPPVAPVLPVAPVPGAPPPGRDAPRTGPVGTAPVRTPPPGGSGPDGTPSVRPPGTPTAPVTAPQAVPRLPGGPGGPARPRQDGEILRDVPPPPVGDGLISGGRSWPRVAAPEPVGRVPLVPGEVAPPRGAVENGQPRSGPPAEPARPASAPRPAVPPGYGHMPFMGAPMGAARDEERGRPSWLVEDDPEAVWFGDLPPHVDPVIGPADRV